MHDLYARIYVLWSLASQKKTCSALLTQAYLTMFSTYTNWDGSSNMRWLLECRTRFCNIRVWTSVHIKLGMCNTFIHCKYLWSFQLEAKLMLIMMCNSPPASTTQWLDSHTLYFPMWLIWLGLTLNLYASTSSKKSVFSLQSFSNSVVSWLTSLASSCGHMMVKVERVRETDVSVK